MSDITFFLTMAGRRPSTVDGEVDIVKVNREDSGRRGRAEGAGRLTEEMRGG